jgi:hypothetical protein
VAPHFDVLVEALEREAQPAPRPVACSRARRSCARCATGSQLADLWRRRPEILRDPLLAPTFVVGSPRSGTSILHELLALDPAHRAPAMWEMQHPVEALAGDALRAVGDAETTFWHDLQPEYETMHANAGDLPNECIFITMHEFLSDQWGGCHNVPTYQTYLAKADPAGPPTATTGASCRRSSSASARALAAQGAEPPVPAARAVRGLSRGAHHPDPPRSAQDDPVLALADGHAQVDALRGVDPAAAPSRARRLCVHLPAPDRAALARRAARRSVRRRALFDVVADPGGTVERVYQRSGWRFAPALRQAVEDYVKRKPKGSRGVHHYSLAEMGLDRRDRAPPASRSTAITFGVAEER